MEQSKFYKIKNITEDKYTLVGCDGSETTRPIQEVDKTASVFTIQDAKDGDVLALNGEVFIYAHRKQMYSIVVAHCFVDSDGKFCYDGEFGYIENENSISPATKEQRNLLFFKMKEAGYEWDAEKKELKRVDKKAMSDKEKAHQIAWETSKHYDPLLSKESWCEMAAIDMASWKNEQKSVWSEEDEKMLDSFLHKLEVCEFLSNKEITWIKNKLNLSKKE